MNNKSDVIKIVTTTTVSAIPIVGGPLANIMNEVLNSSWKRRREEVEKEFKEKIEKIDTAYEQNIMESRNLASLFVGITKDALYDIEEQKIGNYANAIVNTIKKEALTDCKIHIFLNILREFTSAHIKLLRYISELKEEDIDVANKYPFWEGTFPSEEIQALRDVLLEDLYRYKLVKTNPSEERKYDFALTERTFPKYLTSTGKEFLDFISERE